MTSSVYSATTKPISVCSSSVTLPEAHAHANSAINTQKVIHTVVLPTLIDYHKIVLISWTRNSSLLLAKHLENSNVFIFQAFKRQDFSLLKLHGDTLECKVSTDHIQMGEVLSFDEAKSLKLLVSLLSGRLAV